MWTWLRRRFRKRYRVHQSSPVRKIAFGICGHCGAVWDDRHERGECGVSAATGRLLKDYEESDPVARYLGAGGRMLRRTDDVVQDDDYMKRAGRDAGHIGKWGTR